MSIRIYATPAIKGLKEIYLHVDYALLRQYLPPLKYYYRTDTSFVYIPVNLYQGVA